MCITDIGKLRTNWSKEGSNGGKSFDLKFRCSLRFGYFRHEYDAVRCVTSRRIGRMGDPGERKNS